MARQGLRGAIAVAPTPLIAVPASAGANSSSGGTSPEDGSQGSGDSSQSNPSARARISSDGRTAIAPNSAPPQVKRAIAAANKLTRKPYRYGGGHGKWNDSGYTCSRSGTHAPRGGGPPRPPPRPP